METTDTPVTTRVTSPDGTDIAFWTSGRGAPLVLVTARPRTTLDGGPCCLILSRM